MKTLVNINSLKRLTASAGVFAFFGTVLLSQANFENNETGKAIYNLGLLAGSTEKELQYVAPDEDVDCALQNLELLTVLTQEEVTYSAPSVETELALQNLDLLVSATEAELAYRVPSDDEVNAAENLEILAIQTSGRPVMVTASGSIRK